MYLLVDNHDSFVYNLAAYIKECGRNVKVVRENEIDPKSPKIVPDQDEIKGIIISPGPKSPKECSVSVDIVTRFQGKIPILGVCLGHQVIGYANGFRVEKGDKPMHGKVSLCHHNGEGIFYGIPSPFSVTRYHSLVIRECEEMNGMVVTARTTDGVIMGIQNRKNRVFGVQFHPEAVLSEYGHEIIRQFINICENESRLE